MGSGLGSAFLPVSLYTHTHTHTHTHHPPFHALFISAFYIIYHFLCTIITRLTYPCSIYTHSPLLPLRVRTAPLHVRTTLSCPYRRPAGVLALSLGGITHAALLTNLFDAVGFLAASVLSYYAMELGTVRYSTYSAVHFSFSLVSL